MTSPYIKNKLLDLYKLNIFGYLIKYLENNVNLLSIINIEN